jgi:hypothetical protein
MEYRPRNEGPVLRAQQVAETLGVVRIEGEVYYTTCPNCGAQLRVYNRNPKQIFINCLNRTAPCHWSSVLNEVRFRMLQTATRPFNQEESNDSPEIPADSHGIPTSRD